MLFSLFNSSLFILMWEGDGSVWEKSQIQGPGVTNSESGLSRAQEFYSLLQFPTPLSILTFSSLSWQLPCCKT